MLTRPRGMQPAKNRMEEILSTEHVAVFLNKEKAKKGEKRKDRFLQVETYQPNATCGSY